MPVKRLGPEVRSEIVRRFKAGESAIALAEDFGVGRAAIYKVLGREGVTILKVIKEKKARSKPRPKPGLPQVGPANDLPPGERTEVAIDADSTPTTPVREDQAESA